MDKNNLIIQAELSKLLKKEKTLLNNDHALMRLLKEHVDSNYCAMELDFFKNALVVNNIGEFLLSADELSKDERDQKKIDAIARMNNMQDAEAVVETLTEAMGWNQDEQK